MKKLIKFAYTAVLGVAILATAACTDEYSYDSIAPESGQEVFFPTTNASSVSLNMAEGTQTFNVPITRIKAAEPLTVGISMQVAKNSTLFSVPSTVTFAAGESVANIPVSYNATELGYENPDTLTISIADPTATTPYGANTYKCIVMVPSPLELLGTGSFTDNFWFEETAPVQIYQNTLNPNEFRVMDPFAMCTKYSACTGNQSPYVTLTVLQPGETLAGVEITQNDLVYFSSMNTGYLHSSYGAEIWLHHPAAFSSLRTESAWTYSKVIEYQENGLPGRVQLAPYYYMDGVGGWNNTQSKDIVIIDFPGYVARDYTLGLSYSGVFTDAQGVVFAEGIATLGEDATDARAVVVPADADPEAVADAILAGDLEYTSVAAGQIRVPIEEGLTGKLQIVVVVVDDNKVRAIDSAFFEYYGGGKNPWESLGMGLFTDDFVYPLYTESGASATYQVEIQANTEEPGLYRLVDPYGPNHPYYQYADSYKSASIEVNATDPDGVYFFQQSTGLDLGDGEMSILTEGGSYYEYYGPDYYETLKNYGYFGKLEDGVITFPSFNKKDDAGEVQFTYQGWVVFPDESAYRMGRNGELKIVLPSAVTASARKAAASQAKARNFESRLKGSIKPEKRTKRSYCNVVTSHLLLTD